MSAKNEILSDAPKGSPAGFWALATDGTTCWIGGADRQQIMAEYSKLYPHKPAWWWIAGNEVTYQKRAALKRWGCRWKRQRRAFAYVGDHLPDGLLALLDNADECRAIMNGQVVASEIVPDVIISEDVSIIPSDDPQAEAEGETVPDATTDEKAPIRIIPAQADETTRHLIQSLPPVSAHSVEALPTAKDEMMLIPMAYVGGSHSFKTLMFLNTLTK